MRFPDKKYKVLYADPPWRFSNRRTGGSLKSGSATHYELLSVQDICNLPVQDIADDDCVLFMWWVAAMPEEALRVVKAWGFNLKTMTGFNWVKRTQRGKLDFGMGFWTRAGSEMCLIATKGKPRKASSSVRSVLISKKRQHSQKPDEVRERIEELCGNVPRIELFARRKVDEWDSWGLELEDE